MMSLGGLLFTLTSVEKRYVTSNVRIRLGFFEAFQNDCQHLRSSLYAHGRELDSGGSLGRDGLRTAFGRRRRSKLDSQILAQLRK